MITSCDIYIVGRGFIPIDTVSPGDRVYRLNGLKPEIGRVGSVGSEHINKTINVVRTGLQQVEATEDTRFFYNSDVHGAKYIAFNQIERLTPNKEYIANKYLPVLSMPQFSETRNCTDQELEYLTRMLAVEYLAYDEDKFFEISSRMTGDDAFVFIYLLEHWVSEHPGMGMFGKLNRKSRAFFFHSGKLCDEICRLACLTGYCSMVNEFEGGFVLQIFFDGMPIPGNMPKNEKYFKKHHYGLVYNINSGNMPVFGRWGSRAYYLPFTSTLNEGV